MHYIYSLLHSALLLTVCIHLLPYRLKYWQSGVLFLYLYVAVCFTAPFRWLGPYLIMGGSFCAYLCIQPFKTFKCMFCILRIFVLRGNPSDLLAFGESRFGNPPTPDTQRIPSIFYRILPSDSWLDNRNIRTAASKKNQN